MSDANWREKIRQNDFNTFAVSDYLESQPRIEVDVPEEDRDFQSKDYLLYLRFMAWRGQRIDSTDPVAPSIAAPYEWMRFLLESNCSVFLREVSDDDRRFYDKGKVVGASQRIDVPGGDEWKRVLSALESRGCKSQDLTPREFELAMVLFDWNHPTPRFASWVFVRPEIVRDVERLLLKLYCWPLIGIHRRAIEETEKQNSDSTQARRVQNLTQDFSWFRLGRVPWRIFGVIIVGYIATFAADPVQHLIWFGPWPIPLVLSALAICLTSRFALEDVRKQHGGDILSDLVKKRSRQLCFVLFALAIVFSLTVTGLMFCPVIAAWDDSWFLVSSAQDFVDRHPLQTYGGTNADSAPEAGLVTTKGILQWLNGSVALGSLSALLGVAFQWLWEDRSAIEPL